VDPEPPRAAAATKASESTAALTMTRDQQRFMSWMTDVLVYIVVLNLFVEFVDEIVIDSFWISILTAVLLKLMLDSLIGLEHRTTAYFKAREGWLYAVLGALSIFSILFFGKLLILEAVNFVFGDHVELGHFVEIVALIIAMMGTRAAVQAIYEWLG
jgi:hypothetical protein